jgi:hypothetical protein
MIDRISSAVRRASTVLALSVALAGALLAHPASALAGSRFDGQWNITFVTQRGDCDPSYNFTVDVLNGNISHPNILTFRGHVAPSGAARASVRVGEKSASGSGTLAGTVGRGVWRGRSGTALCAGTWTAQRN